MLHIRVRLEHVFDGEIVLGCSQGSTPTLEGAALWNGASARNDLFIYRSDERIGNRTIKLLP